MNHDFPIFTVENSCQDCYKCVRYCPCKAIRVTGGRAAVIPELCVSCGRCVQVCPAGAKKIRPDMSRARYLLGRGKKVYASLAPSFVSFFRDLPREKLIAGLLKLGFAGVSETALGAEIVSAESARLLETAEPGIYLSSACPAAVEYFRKYTPRYAARITPLLSPLLTHCRMLRREFGDEIAIVFFGPCAAKKLEADRHPELLDLALTFEDLVEWFAAEKIDPAKLDGGNAAFVPRDAAEGRIYPLEGGMNDTLRGGNQHVHYLALSGLLNFERVMRQDPDGADRRDGKFFIECLGCDGGCVNGPAMPEHGSALSGLIAAARGYDGANSRDREIPFELKEPIRPESTKIAEPDEEEIRNALASVGKYSRADELNCGGCGYSRCRDFARALVAGKAESEMCVSHMRELAQKKSNALIRHLPAGVVIANRELEIIECNRHFAELFDESTRLAYEAMPGLAGADLRSIVDFAEFFETVLASGGELLRPNHVTPDGRILNLSIFSIEPHRIVGAIAQDVTTLELQREQISERAREVIRKNVFTVQKIAHYLGEHMAETEILLREVAGNYSSPETREKSDP
ncbi:MAG: [Fe-Fe] hydrogenase large subunit C-terminal domain-containing protein [Victivallaceae bacterium]